MTVPLDALGAGVTSIDVSVEPVADTAALTDAVPAPQGTVIVAGQAYDIDITDDQGTALTQFSPPLALTFTVDPAVTDPATVVVFSYDAATGSWVLVDPLLVTASVDGTVTVSIDHLALFALFVDTAAPLVTAPADITVELEAPADRASIDQAEIAAFLAGAGATDNIDDAVDLTNDAPDAFPVGTTTITFTAMDGAGNTGTAAATVTILAGELVIPTAFQDPPPNGNFRVWLDPEQRVSEALAGIEDTILIVWIWDSNARRWLSWPPTELLMEQTDFTLTFGAVLWVVGA